MNATHSRVEATPARRRLNVELFDSLAAKRGATTAAQRAELAGVDRATYFRWRAGGTAPALDIATHAAKQLGVTVDDLWPPRSEETP